MATLTYTPIRDFPQPYLEFRCFDLFIVASMSADQLSTKRLGLKSLARAAFLLTSGGASELVHEIETEANNIGYFYPVYEKFKELLPLDAIGIRALGLAIEKDPRNPISLRSLADAFVELDKENKIVWDRLIANELVFEKARTVPSDRLSEIETYNPIDLTDKVIVLFHYLGRPVTAVFQSAWKKDPEEGYWEIEGRFLTPNFGGGSSSLRTRRLRWPIPSQFKYQIIPESEWPIYSKGLWLAMPVREPKSTTVFVDLFGLEALLNDLIIRTSLSLAESRNVVELIDVVVYAANSDEYRKWLNSMGFLIVIRPPEIPNIGEFLCQLKGHIRRTPGGPHMASSLLFTIARSVELSEAPIVSAKCFFDALVELGEISGIARVSYGCV